MRTQGNQNKRGPRLAFETWGTLMCKLKCWGSPATRQKLFYRQ
jgi:hypothetical protein